MVEINNLKSLKKDLKDFKKIAKKDMLKGSEKAEEINLKIQDLLKDNQIENNSKFKGQLDEMIEILDLYLNNVKTLKKIKSKK